MTCFISVGSIKTSNYCEMEKTNKNDFNKLPSEEAYPIPTSNTESKPNSRPILKKFFKIQLLIEVKFTRHHV